MSGHFDSEDYVEWIRRRAASRKRLAYVAIAVSLIALAVMIIIGK